MATHRSVSPPNARRFQVATSRLRSRSWAEIASSRARVRPSSLRRSPGVGCPARPAGQAATEGEYRAGTNRLSMRTRRLQVGRDQSSHGSTNRGVLLEPGESRLLRAVPVDLIVPGLVTTGHDRPARQPRLMSEMGLVEGIRAQIRVKWSGAGSNRRHHDFQERRTAESWRIRAI